MAKNGGHSGEVGAALIGKRKRGLSEFVGFYSTVKEPHFQHFQIQFHAEVASEWEFLRKIL